MIKSIHIKNYIDDQLEIELTNPEKSGFYIKDIEGIGSPVANINLTEVATNDGALFNSSRVTSRSITMTLGFFWKGSIENIRHLSYKYFPTKRPLTLTIESSNRTGEIIGYVESNEPIIFSERQTTIISLICPDPFFYSKDLMVTTFEGVVPLFEFPFSNESLEENLLIMGDIWPEATRSIVYEGDAEVGVVIHILSTGEVSNMTIYNPGTNQRMVISHDRLVTLTGYGIIEGDHIIISTVRGNKHITLIRDGLEINILNALNRDAFWFQLHKGDNIFAYTAEGGLSNIIFRIENRIAYEGV